MLQAPFRGVESSLDVNGPVQNMKHTLFYAIHFVLRIYTAIETLYLDPFQVRASNINTAPGRRPAVSICCLWSLPSL